jgi:Ca2+-binding RTX toxin-like protein
VSFSQNGMPLRVAASFVDGLGTPETVFSAATEAVSFINTLPTGSVSIDDTTPVLTQVLTASNTLADAQGLGAVAYQWQVSNDDGATWDDIVGATGTTYAVTEVGARLRVAVSYTDGFGTLETVFSDATDVVAAFNSITGTGAANMLIGTELPDFIQAFGGNDTLIGGTGNDTLDGGTGSDSMVGGTGDDTYVVDATTDVVVELPDEGIDTVQSALLNYTLGDNVENLVLLGAATRHGTGNAADNVLTGNNGANQLLGLDGNDTLIGNGGNDTLSGGTGADNMTGGTGNDLYFVDDAGDQVVEVAGGGTADEVRTTLVGYTLDDQVEVLRFIGVGDFAGMGNALNNRLFGGAGNDTLDGGAGNDTMTGGTGNDSYHVDGTGDVVVEGAGGGVDTVITSGNYTLSANVENLVSTNAVGATLLGNALSNQIQGGDGNDSIVGGGGNDTLNGGAGNDMLDGGTGNDSMTGGAGDDSYVVNAAADVVVELADEGTDTVQSALLNYTLGDNVENLVLLGAATRHGTGNTADNVLTGNNGANLLQGMDGNDTLIGNGGNDTLIGGAGNDTMSGGTGNDIFRFFNGFGQDVINGFDANPANGQDLLNISPLGITAGNFGANVLISDDAGNTLISFTGITDTITLVGVNAATVTQQDFILS